MVVSLVLGKKTRFQLDRENYWIQNLVYNGLYNYLVQRLEFGRRLVTKVGIWCLVRVIFGIKTKYFLMVVGILLVTEASIWHVLSLVLGINMDLKWLSKSLATEDGIWHEYESNIEYTN